MVIIAKQALGGGLAAARTHADVVASFAIAAWAGAEISAGRSDS